MRLEDQLQLGYSADLRHERIKNLAIAEHSHNTKHQFSLENSIFLAIVPNYYKRKIWEAIEIEKCVKKFNQDDRLRRKETWKPVVKKIIK